MEIPNANIVCNRYFSLARDCPSCPIKAECNSKPLNPNHPIDWEHRIERAAIEFLRKEKQKQC